jgi:predicted metalloendopeptidase
VRIGASLFEAIDGDALAFDAEGALAPLWDEPTAHARASLDDCLAKALAPRRAGDAGADAAFDAAAAFAAGPRASPPAVVAEIAGLTAAVRAWSATLSPSDRASGGAIALRRFFLAYAQSRCEVGDLATTAATRVDVALANLPEFTSAFACTAPAPMSGTCRVF